MTRGLQALFLSLIVLVSTHAFSAPTQIECKLLKRERGKKSEVLGKAIVPIQETAQISAPYSTVVKSGLLSDHGLWFYIEISYGTDVIAYTETPVTDDSLGSLRLNLTIPQTKTTARCRVK